MITIGCDIKYTKTDGDCDTKTIETWTKKKDVYLAGE